MLNPQHPAHVLVFWAECFRDNCGLHQTIKVTKNFFPRRKRKTAIHDVYTTKNLPFWDLRMKLQSKPAAIFTPQDSYPIACCNQAGFPWYKCTKSICRIHMLAKTQAWYKQKSRRPGPAPITKIVWNPNTRDNDRTTQAKKTPAPHKEKGGKGGSSGSKN